MDGSISSLNQRVSNAWSPQEISWSGPTSTATFTVLRGMSYATLEGGKDVVLDIDVQGHSQVRRRLPEALSVFLLPPSFNELARRLRRRHSDSAEVIESRLVAARKEISHWSEYDYLIVNDSIPTAVQAVKTVVLAARFRRQHQQGVVEEIRETFGG